MPAPQGNASGRAALALLLPCVLTVALLVGWAWANRRTLELPTDQRRSTVGIVFPTLERWKRTKSGPWPKAILFGDSLCGCHDARVASSIEKAAIKARAMAFVGDAAFPGMRPLQFYAALPEVLEAHPTIVIVELNYTFLTGVLHRLKGYGFRQVARALPLSRIGSMTEAMTEDDITPLDPIVFRLFNAADALYLADGLRDRGQQSLEAWGSAANAALGLREVRFLKLPHFDATRAREVYTPGASRSMQLPVFRALAADVRATGARMLFYVSPLNVGLLDSLGVRAELDLPAHVEALRQALGAAPSEWLDLHALLPQEDFRDAWGHLLDPGCEAVAARLADAIRTPPAH